MRKRLITVFLLIVIVPLGVVTWLGMRSISGEREREYQRYSNVLENSLKDVDGRIADLFQAKQIEFLRLEDVVSSGIDEIRRFLRKSPDIRQIFVFDAGGAMIVPPEEGSRSSKEREFFDRIANIGLTRDMLVRPSDTDRSTPASSGWYTWFWGEGINFIFWYLDSLHRTIGVEIERAALLAEIFSILPDAGVGGRAEADERGQVGGPEQAGHGAQPGALEESVYRTILTNASDKVMYQWGDYQPGERDEPLASISLSAPLNSWKLSYYADRDTRPALFSSSRYFILVVSVLILIIAVAALAVYFYRENSREIREASQRMSFVNQVSHELKTPLTNIRMYAELLEKGTLSNDERSRKYLDVVISESRRLSRLIGNVLTFARKRQNGVRLVPKPGIVDETIAATIENCKPMLTAAGIEMAFAPGAGREVRFDSDVLDQILHNLISNVEKYASSGKWLGIVSRQDENTAVIRVSDRGPGIPAKQRENVFKPFVRLSNKLTDGVSGTGIGLTIARELALLHGGSLELDSSSEGTTFVIAIQTSFETESE